MLIRLACARKTGEAVEKGNFIRIDHDQYDRYGIGKIENYKENIVTVSFFDSPVRELVRLDIPVEWIRPARVARQTRAYWPDVRQDIWRVGRVMEHDGSEIEVRFPNRNDQSLPTSDVFVRWDRPLADPTGYLAQKINETPIFSDARSGFMNALMAQRRASMGMPALFSSVIDLEIHQIEVVRRVLQDPVQRYLLADEVGLGKTIEAGILVRQYVIDDPTGHRVVIIVPPALMLQWRDELKRRFLLEVELDNTVLVIPFDDRQGVEDSLQGAGMVVVDEAHHIRRGEWLFELLAKEAASAPRFLLLSATPVLGNETGFLEMLHLLDPLVFPLDSIESFQRKIANRQALVEAVAGLIAENLLQIEDYLDSLTQLFPDDDQLLGLADLLKRIVDEFPEECDPRFLEALSALRAHVAETYRLDRRILRNRRKAVQGLTPDREGVTFKDYESPAMARFAAALEEWRSQIALTLYDKEETEEAVQETGWFVQVIEALASRESVEFLNEMYLRPRLQSADQSGSEILREMISALELLEGEGGGLDVVSSAVREADPNTKFIVFCSTSETAYEVHAGLSDRLSFPIDRYEEDFLEDYEDSVFSRFLNDSNHRVIVCDRRAEEGLNLQGGDKVLVHFDLPLSPNRIEQRLGRVDRYGTGASIQSIAVRCLSNPFDVAWTNCLDTGLEVFNRSIASLQYLIDDEMRDLKGALLFEGIEAISTMAERLGGSDGEIAKELRRIDEQDALDALIVPDEESFDDLFEEDDRWLEFQASVDAWLVDVLLMQKMQGPQIGPLPHGDSVFRYMLSHRGGQETLIPLDRFLDSFISVLDSEAPGSSYSRPLSFPYTSRRRTSLSLRAREQKVRLLRYGDTFLKGLSELTALDDRGRSVALWRQRSNYTAVDLADVYFRFDFVIEAETDRAAQDYAEAMGGALDTARAALRRRGDMTFPPTFHKVWLDGELDPVVDPEVLSLLKEPYIKRPVEEGNQDHNLNAERWEMVEGLGLSVVDYWADLVVRARAKAEEVLCHTTDLEDRIEAALRTASSMDQGRFAQLQTRIRHADKEEAKFESKLLEIERAVAERFYEGIRSPRITLDTIGAAFLSEHALEYLAMTRHLRQPR